MTTALAAPAGRNSALKAFRGFSSDGDSDKRLQSGQFSASQTRSKKDDRQALRYELFGLLLHQHRTSTRKSQRLCLKAPIRDQVATLGRRGSRAAVMKVVTCGSPDCPWCAARWSETRAANLALAIQVHAAAGGFYVMATYTLKHGRRDRIEDLWESLGKAFTYATHGKKSARSKLKDRTVGFVVTKEVKYGDSGWHPHLHVGYFVKPGNGLREVNDLIADQQAAIESHLRKHAPANWSEKWSKRYGVALSEVVSSATMAEKGETAGDVAARYMAKDVAREMTAGYAKDRGRAGNRTPMQLLRDAAAGDAHAQRVYHAYEIGMMGRRRQRWSPGLAASLFGDDADQLLAAVNEDDQARGIAELPRPLWDALRYSRWENGLGVTDLLDAIEETPDDREAFALISLLCSEAGLPAPEPVARLPVDLRD
jgi:hypothetical protein